MPERLQTNAGAIRESDYVDGTTSLILDNKYCDTVIKFIRDAQSEIRLCAYAWRWYIDEPEIPIQQLNIELYRARERGVKVRCLVDTAATAQMLRDLNFNVRYISTNRMLHTKAIGIDEKTLVIGSHNLTKRASTDNYELSLLTQEPQVVLGYNDYFDRMWQANG